MIRTACAEARRRTASLGRLDAADTDAHLRECRECRAWASGLETARLLRWYGALPVDSPPAEADRRAVIVARLSGRRLLPVRLPAVRPAWAIAPALAGALAIAGVGGWRVAIHSRAGAPEDRARVARVASDLQPPRRSPPASGAAARNRPRERRAIGWPSSGQPRETGVVPPPGLAARNPLAARIPFAGGPLVTAGSSRRAPPAQPLAANRADDLRYVNGPGAGRPAPRPRMASAAGDDFIVVPRPRIAAADSPSTRAIVSDAVRSYEQERAVVDGRLAQKVTVALPGSDLHALMAALAAQTHVRFDAAKELEDVKLTVLAKEQPVRDLMRQVARLFDFEWRRYGEEGKYRYELTQSLKGRLAEEERKRQDADQMLLDATGQMDSYLKYRDAPSSQLKSLAAEAQQQAQTAGSVEERERQLSRYTMLSILSDEKSRDLLNVYASMTPEQLISLRNGDAVTFRYRGDGTEATLPREYAERIREGAIHGFSPGGADARPDRLEWAQNPIESEQVQLTFRMDRTRPDQSMLSAGLQFEVMPQGGADSGGGGKGGAGIAQGGYNWGDTVLVTGQPDRMRDPGNEAAHSGLASEPDWRSAVDLHPHADSAAAAPGPWAQDLLTRTSATADPVLTTRGWIDSGDFFAELHRRTGRNIVADYYTRIYAPSALSASGKLLDALDGAADVLKSSWEKDGEFLRFRQFDYYAERAMDVPNRLLRRWAADRKKLGHLTMDDLAEAAARPDAVLQHRDLGRAVLLKHGLDEWPLAYAARAELRFYAMLTHDQRDRALSAQGLPFTALGADQLAAAQTATRTPAPFTPDEIQRGRFMARLREPGVYEWTEMTRDALATTPIPIAVTLRDTSAAGIEAQVRAYVAARGGRIDAVKRSISGPGAAVLTRFDYGDQYFARETNGSHSLIMSTNGGGKE